MKAIYCFPVIHLLALINCLSLPSDSTLAALNTTDTNTTGLDRIALFLKAPDEFKVVWKGGGVVNVRSWEALHIAWRTQYFIWSDKANCKPEFETVFHDHSSSWSWKMNLNKDIDEKFLDAETIEGVWNRILLDQLRNMKGNYHTVWRFPLNGYSIQSPPGTDIGTMRLMHTSTEASISNATSFPSSSDPTFARRSDDATYAGQTNLTFPRDEGEQLIVQFRAYKEKLTAEYMVLACFDYVYNIIFKTNPEMLVTDFIKRHGTKTEIEPLGDTRMNVELIKETSEQLGLRFKSVAKAFTATISFLAKGNVLDITWVSEVYDIRNPHAFVAFDQYETKKKPPRE